MSMDSISVYGGIPLQGRVKIQGSKNAVLPILAATLLTHGENVIYNCPRISDVFCMQQLLKCLGCVVRLRSDCMLVKAEWGITGSLPAEAVKGMRSSLCLLSTLLSRTGKIVMEYPGGCVIGARPIDLHLEALTAMGARFWEERDRIHGCVPGGFHGAKIVFPKVSVGATENVILAAVLAEGETVIEGAAKEPEVVALCEYLKSCGAIIAGEGTEHIVIRGVKQLSGTVFRIPSDRIVAGTYLFAVLAAGGNAFLEDAPCEQMHAVLDVAKRLGISYQIYEEGIYIQSPEEIHPIKYLETEEYPGFPTDLQSVALATMTRMQGEGLIEEKIFENRFHVVQPLCDMGADIKILDNRHIWVKGVERLQGRPIEAKELRGGAALVVAGLAAQGCTKVTGYQYILRGYENISRDLKELGARVISV